MDFEKKNYLEKIVFDENKYAENDPKKYTKGGMRLMDLIDKKKYSDLSPNIENLSVPIGLIQTKQKNINLYKTNETIGGGEHYSNELDDSMFDHLFNNLRSNILQKNKTKKNKI